MSRIVAFETWVARNPRAGAGATPGAIKEDERVAPAPPGSFTVVVRLRADDGAEGVGTAFSAYGPAVPLGYLRNVLAPVVLGRHVHEREAIWCDLVRLDRSLAFFPVPLPGPVDVALWDLAARQAGLPLHHLLGSARDAVPVYASSGFLPSIDHHLEAAASALDRGIGAYKIHPVGDWRQHIEIARAVRDRFPDLVLMLDAAVSDYTVEDALRVGRALEALDFHWFEEPFHDAHLGKYARLARDLDIPIAATEASTGGPAAVAQFIRNDAADIVRADVSWKWGVTGVRKVQHLAEAFGINCEVHTTTMGVMDVANLHLECAATNGEYHELLNPEELWSFPLAAPLPVSASGRISPPEGPGLGLEIDWNDLDDYTILHSH